MDISKISDLSLFLWENSLVLLAKEQDGTALGVHLYKGSIYKNLPGIIHNDSFINSDITTGKLFVHNAHFCLIPGQIFDPSNSYLYLRFSCGIQETGSEIFYDGFENNQLQLVGAVELEVPDLLDSLLPDLEITHGSSLFLSYVLHHRFQYQDQEIMVLINDPGSIYLAAFEREDLKLFNRFEIANKEDFLKYILVAIQSLKFDRLNCKTSLFGEPSKLAIEKDFLLGYFNHLEIKSPTCNLNYQPGADKFKETNLLEAFWNI